MAELDDFLTWKAERDAQVAAVTEARRSLLARIDVAFEAWKAERDAQAAQVAARVDAAPGPKTAGKRLTHGEHLAHLPPTPVRAVDDGAARAKAEAQARHLQQLRERGKAMMPAPTPAPAPVDRAAMRANDEARARREAELQARQEERQQAQRVAELEAAAAKQAAQQRSVDEARARTVPPPPAVAPASVPMPPQPKPLTEKQQRLLSRLEHAGRPVLPQELGASEEELEMLCWLGVAGHALWGRERAFVAVPRS